MDQPVVPGYRVTHRLGTGGSGTVWAATRKRDGADLALKVVPVGAGPAVADQVARELAVLQRLHVDGMVGFHEAFGLASDPPSVAIVLDRVDGGSLVSVLAARGRLSVGEAVTVLTPVARVLAGLHAAGVVHGDVSPANVLFERNGRPLLADLGVARLIGQEPGAVYGTDGCVAPEVALGALPGPAADVYAVGALAWWCLTGMPPGPPALRRPLTDVAAGLPEAWVQVMSGCLAADPAGRPSAAEAALLFFDAAPCEPLHLVVAGDETSLLTHRIRCGAPPPVAASPPARRSADSRRLRQLALVAVPASVGLVGALLAAASSGQLAEVWSPGVAPAPPATSSRPSPSRAAEVLRDRSSPVTAVHSLMQQLAERRAAAMNSGDVTDLGEADAPASPALATDSALLRQLSSAGLRYVGVALEVRSAHLERQHAATAKVRARVDTSAYQVVDRSGRSQPHAAKTGAELSFDLAWSGGRWRVFRVTASAADG
jgi:eukaryotic-like serine/threonine-protein kinase